jgi:hypothetical protein
MEFDPQHGPVERGTAGHRASAEVASIAMEIEVLSCWESCARYEHHPLPSGAQRERRAAALRDLIGVLDFTIENARDNARDELKGVGGCYSAAALMRVRRRAQDAARHAVYAKLARLAPYVEVLLKGDAQRQRRAADYSARVSTREASHANH